MNICEKVQEVKKHKFKIGNLYKGTKPLTKVCIAIGYETLVVLETGLNFVPKDFVEYEDVTDQYCLQKVK